MKKKQESLTRIEFPDVRGGGHRRGGLRIRKSGKVHEVTRAEVLDEDGRQVKITKVSEEVPEDKSKPKPSRQ